MSGLNIVPFDRERHLAFVADTFVRSLTAQWPWSELHWQPLTDRLKRHLADPAAVTLVAEVEGVDGAFAGWACAAPSRNEVVYAYTRQAYRPLRTVRVMSELLAAAYPAVDWWSGPDRGSPPIAVRYWTRAAEEIALSKGWPLYWRMTP